MGVCGLRRVGGREDVEILYSLEPAAWGQGLATEAGRAVLGFAFGELRLARVLGGFDAPNTASSQVLARLGMKPEADVAGEGGVIYWGLSCA